MGNSKTPASHLEKLNGATRAALQKLQSKFKVIAAKQKAAQRIKTTLTGLEQELSTQAIAASHAQAESESAEFAKTKAEEALNELKKARSNGSKGKKRKDDAEREAETALKDAKATAKQKKADAQKAAKRQTTLSGQVKKTKDSLITAHIEVVNVTAPVRQEVDRIRRELEDASAMLSDVIAENDEGLNGQASGRRRRPQRPKNKPEYECKIRVNLDALDLPKDKSELTLEEHVQIEAEFLLRDVFRHVVQDDEHYVKKDIAGIVTSFPEFVRGLIEKPLEYGSPKANFFLCNPELKGIDENGKSLAEIRCREKSDGAWQVTAKVSAKDKSTKKRLEEIRGHDALGVNYSFFSAAVATELHDTLGDGDELKPLIVHGGQSIRVLYHPDGDPDTTLELKIDIQIGETFDGFKYPVTEVEIEYKNGPLEDSEINALIQKEMNHLMSVFDGKLVEVDEPKTAPGNRHLFELRRENPEAFTAGVNELPDSWYQDGHKPKVQPA